jgi:enoyl-CoA hydratase/carnithine racemase
MTPFADGALLLSIDGPIAWLTLNRPGQRNALNEAMWRALPAVAAQIAADPSVRVLIVRGAGGHFASGADIGEFPVVLANREAALRYKHLGEQGIDALANLEAPVIALIEGYCVGAGLAIALACDLRLAAAGARFAAPPAKLGLVYSLKDTRRLIDAVGASRAKAMLFTGALLDTSDALNFGLVDEVHPSEQAEDAARALATNIAQRSSWSARGSKAIVRLALSGALEETTESLDWYANAVEGPDFAEGLAAFMQKRPPVFD